MDFDKVCEIIFHKYRKLLIAIYLICAVICCAALIQFIISGIHFHEFHHSKELWYSDDIIEDPYTNIALKLFGTNQKIYWKNNAIGNQFWEIKETQLGDTVYWTTLQRWEIKHD